MDPCVWDPALTGCLLRARASEGGQAEAPHPKDKGGMAPSLRPSVEFSVSLRFGLPPLSTSAPLVQPPTSGSSNTHLSWLRHITPFQTPVILCRGPIPPSAAPFPLQWGAPPCPSRLVFARKEALSPWILRKTCHLMMDVL